MSGAVELVLDRLAAHDCRPRRSGAGWCARCPARADRAPSLTIAEGLDGRALLRCWAGCATGAVVASLDLTMRDLFAGGGKPAVRRLRPADPREPVRPKATSIVGLSGSAFLRALDDLGLRYEDGTAPGRPFDPESSLPGGCMWEPGRPVCDGRDRPHDRHEGFAYLCRRTAERVPGDLDRATAVAWLAQVGARSGFEQAQVTGAIEGALP